MILEVLIFVVALVAYFAIRDRKPKGMPPGPFEIPFIGNTPCIEDCHIEPLKKYGPIVTTRFGPRTVVIFDYHIGKEVLASHDFENRPAFVNKFSIDDTKKGGIVNANGEQWQHDRRFVLRNLRNLGMGKSYLETAIHTEAQELVEDLKSFNGEPTNFPESLKTVALNIIWQLVAGKRYEFGSKEVMAVYEANNSFREDPSSKYFFIPELFPALKMMPKFFFDKMFKPHLFDDFCAEMKRIVVDAVAEHENKMSTVDEEKEDFLSQYLMEMKNKEKDPDSKFYRGSLHQVINELFQAGSDTVSNQLKWTIYLMAKHPEITSKVQKEIYDNVPKGRLVSLTDRPNLPMMEAFMTETLRYGSQVVLNIVRAAGRDTYIQEYFIPKGTIVTIASINIHYDPKYWDKPEEFNPERFIDEEGKFQAPKEAFVPFGTGRRVCVGETLARMEYFLFSATLVQNFNIRVPEGSTIVDECHSAIGFRAPQSQPFIYEYRQ